MAAYLEWRCHITLTTRSSPQSIISVRQQSQGSEFISPCDPSVELICCSGNWILVVHDSDSSQTLKTFSALNDWLDDSWHRTQQYNITVTKELKKITIIFCRVSQVCLHVDLCALSYIKCTVHACVCVWVSLCAGLYVQCCQEAGVCQEACVLGAASQSKRGAVSLSDRCSRRPAQAETAHPCQMLQH